MWPLILAGLQLANQVAGASSSNQELKEKYDQFLAEIRQKDEADRQASQKALSQNATAMAARGIDPNSGSPAQKAEQIFDSRRNNQKEDFQMMDMLQKSTQRKSDDIYRNLLLGSLLPVAYGMSMQNAGGGKASAPSGFQSDQAAFQPQISAANPYIA